MKYILAVVVSLAAASVAPWLAAEPQVTAKAEINLGFFYDRLSPHGTWVKADTYGWVFQPAEVGLDWRPYSDGRWVYSNDCGWCFTSDTEWGWAAYHYGRWTQVNSRWVWVPGNEWAGAWVVWRRGGEHIGWAPLPPSVKWESGSGLKTADVKFETDIPETSWVFVSQTDFTAPKISSRVKVADEARTIVVRTSVAGTVSLSGGVIKNDALPIKEVETATGMEIKRLTIRPAETLGAALIRSDSTTEVVLFQPTVQAGGSATPPDAKDQEKIGACAKKTLAERHEAESKVLSEKHMRESKIGGGDAAEVARAQQQEKEELEKRQKREVENCDKRYASKDASKDREGSDAEPGRGAKDKDKEQPGKDRDNGKKN